MFVKSLWSRFKPYLQWFVLGGTLFFLGVTLKQHWQEVGRIKLTPTGWGYLAIALGITLAAHLWSGWVWGWMLKFFKQPVSHFWSLRIYLKTNIAKYIPGNVWHFYGRVWAAQKVGIPLSVAILTVLMEPLLMAAAALIITLISNPAQQWQLKLLSLAGILILIHPQILNPVIRVLGRSKVKTQDPKLKPDLQLTHYPIVPLVGEIGFVGLRGIGFLFVFLALDPSAPFTVGQMPLLISVFSFAWLLGLVVPGAPGGVGIFEVTVLSLLKNHFPVALILGVVAFYRLISVLAETLGAGMAWWYDRQYR
jgi:uncharacterized membrane protein YbhN (UPF0104 family)